MIDYKYSIADICSMYGEKRTTYLRDAIRKNKVPAKKVGGRWFIEEKNLNVIKKYLMKKQKGPMSW